MATLRAVLKTSKLALFEVSAGQIRCRYIDPSTDSRAERVWAEQRGELLGGVTVRAEGTAYFPIVRERVVGVLEAIGVDDRLVDPYGMSMLMCALQVLPEALECMGTARAVAERADAERVMRVALDELDRQRLRARLEQHDWIVSAVAREQGVDRGTIYRKMKKLGVRRTEPSPKDPRRGGTTLLATRTVCG